jgi:hypothetical protein
MLFAVLGLGVASLVALGTSRLRISAWWILAPGAAAFALLVALYPAESNCEPSRAVGYAAFVEAMRAGEGRRLLPIAVARF